MNLTANVMVLEKWLRKGFLLSNQIETNKKPTGDKSMDWVKRDEVCSKQGKPCL